MPPYPVRREETIAAALRRLQTGDWTRLEGAPDTEDALHAFHGGGQIWYVASGTAALEAILLGHGIGPGDEVITTPYTWGATVSAILAIGAIPVFGDVDRGTGLLDPATVEAVITPRTRAILAVHLFGCPADMTALGAIARRHHLFLFEDGSQAHGARWHGQRVGRLGHAAAFSCMALKLLAGTEGGYAIFEDPAAAEVAYLYGKHPRGLPPAVAARLQGEGLLDTLQLGWRPCAIGAELVKAQLPYLDEERAARRENLAELRRQLARVPHVTLPHEPAGAESGVHLLSLLYHPEVTGVPLTDFVARLGELGAGAFRYIPVPIHRMKRLNPVDYTGPRVLWHEQLLRAGMDYRRVHLPQVEWRAAHSFELGFNWTLPNPRAMGQLAEAIATAAQPTTA